MVAAVKVDTQRVGALPVISEFGNRLRLADIVNTHVPWKGEVPLGDLVEILVANRLLEPKPIYKVGSWATKATCNRSSPVYQLRRSVAVAVSQ